MPFRRWGSCRCPRSSHRGGGVVLDRNTGAPFAFNDLNVEAQTLGRHSQDNRLAVTLGCSIEHAPKTVYAQPFQVGNPDLITPIGINCRLCPASTARRGHISRCIWSCRSTSTGAARQVSRVEREVGAAPLDAPSRQNRAAFFLGSQLFQRATRGVQLTDKARELARDLTKSLDLMDAAVGRLKASGMIGTLRISVVPWYGNRLLVPNLAGFRAANPGLELDLEFSYELADFQSSDFHAALRHGSGNWPGLSSYQLHNDQVSPVCAPTLVQEEELLLSPDKISRMELAIGHGQEDGWYTWFAAAGFENRELRFTTFENRVLATEFALAGNGVTLPNLPMVANELRFGQLIRLHPQIVTLESGVHLAFPKTQYPNPRLQVVADWITDIISELECSDRA